MGMEALTVTPAGAQIDRGGAEQDGEETPRRIASG